MYTSYWHCKVEWVSCGHTIVSIVVVVVVLLLLAVEGQL